MLIQHSFKQGLADVYQLLAQSEKKDLDNNINFNIKAVNLGPHNAELSESLGQLYLEKAAQSTTNNPQFINNAIASFQNAIQLNPTNYKYHLFLAHGNFKLDNDSEKFMEKLLMIETLDPHNEIISKYKNKFGN